LVRYLIEVKLTENLGLCLARNSKHGALPKASQMTKNWRFISFKQELNRAFKESGIPWKSQVWVKHAVSDSQPLIAIIKALYHTGKITVTLKQGNFHPKPLTSLLSGKVQTASTSYAHQWRSQTNTSSYWSVEGAPALSYVWTTWSPHV